MVQSVERALRILEELGKIRDRTEGIGLLELSRLIQLKSPTTHNLLKTLVCCGYAEKISRTNKYKLGQSCFDLVEQESIIYRLTKASEDTILSLARKVQESIVLAAYHRGERFAVSRVQGQRPLTVDTTVIVEDNIYKTVTGRIILSELSDEELRDYVKRHGLPGKEWKRASNLKLLMQELAKIKKEGMASNKVDNGQIYALAVPVLGRKEGLIASLGTYLPSVRFKGMHKKEIIKGLKDAAKEISIRFNGVRK